MASALSVGELAVELEARTKQFSARMRGAEKRIQRFEGQAGKSTKAAGLSFRNLIGPITAVAGALAAIGAVRAFAGVARGAVQGAAAFEGYEVRLRALLGSQEAANKSLESFVTLSTRTPFAVEQIVSGAATLASVAGGSREELEELTLVSANLAAVTGLKFEEASGNLQRALASGIASADLFRDRGVKKLIEEVNGIPDFTKLSLEEQRELFKKTFGSATMAPYGKAAEDLSKTLGGALSNISDAADNASRSLGKALSPAVFGAARGVVIPFFESVKTALDENQDAITDFAVEGISGLVRGFGKILNTGADILELLSALGVDLSDVGDIIRVLQEMFGIFFEAVRLGFNVIVSGVALLAEGIGKVGRALGLVSDEDVRLLERFRTESFEKLAADAEAFGGKAEEALFQSALAIQNLADDGDVYADKLRAAAEFAGAGADEIERQAAAFRKMREEQAAATGEQEVLAAKRKSDIDNLIAGINAEFAEIDREFNEQVLTGKIQLDTASIEDAGESIEGVFSGMFDRMLEDLSVGGAVETFGETLAGVSSDLFRDSMKDVLGELGGSLKDVLEGAFSGLGEAFGGSGLGQWLSGLGGVGGFDWGAGLGAAAGLGGQMLSGVLRDTEASVRNSMVRSAVTSTQAVRGIVAGPSSIPIAQVGDAIRDAQGEQVTELRRGNRILEAILEAIRSGESVTMDASEALANAVASEMSGSVALG